MGEPVQREEGAEAVLFGRRFPGRGQLGADLDDLLLGENGVQLTRKHVQEWGIGVVRELWGRRGTRRLGLVAAEQWHWRLLVEPAHSTWTVVQTSCEPTEALQRRK
ncbi:hypothetical protein UK23_42510 [Lentzea aerocolonigenes]|uniref:Uncharacterized protein n=1 Tax=Lentzea aerocolonigenes TaxID=68170 RepID=A0A0F0GFT9_LENAE|nr:hypothetical protein UK23_42510 [Lentzea aerocolonigenes]